MPTETPNMNPGGAAGDQPPPAGQPPAPPSGLRDMGARPGTPPPGAAPSAPPAGTPTDPSQRPRTPASALPNEALSARLERQKRTILRDLGIEDPAKFKAEREAERAELARLKEQEEAGKRAQMSELQRLQADRDAEKALREAAEAKVRDLEEIATAHAQEQLVRGAALKFVDPEMYDYARVDFQRHVRDLEKRDPKKLAAMSDEDVEKFFRDLVKKKPRLAPVADPPGPPKPAPSKPATPPRPALPSRASTLPARRAAPGGSIPQRQPPPQGPQNGRPGAPLNGKVVKPGQPNSMNQRELQEHLRSQGRKPW